MHRTIYSYQRVMYVLTENQCKSDNDDNAQDARTLLPQLASLVNSKLKVLIWVCSLSYDVEGPLTFFRRLAMLTSCM